MTSPPTPSPAVRAMFAQANHWSLLIALVLPSAKSATAVNTLDQKNRTPTATSPELRKIPAGPSTAV